jgi:hypothetical protein
MQPTASNSHGITGGDHQSPVQRALGIASFGRRQHFGPGVESLQVSVGYAKLPRIIALQQHMAG